MPDNLKADRKPAIYSIAAHRGFADALVAGLIPRYRDGQFGLARLTLLLPSRRAVRTVTEAFIRASGDATGAVPGGGLLLPRMAVVGDLDLDEALGPLLDPIGAGASVLPAVDPVYRLCRVANVVGEELAKIPGGHVPGAAGLFRQARNITRTMDRLLVEDIAPDRLLTLDMVQDLAGHWQDALRLFARSQTIWKTHLEELGKVDAAERRNRLLDHAAKRWREQPPAFPIVAAGVTSSAPAVARLLRTIADLPNGSVVLPDLDLMLDEDVWNSLGRAGADDGDGQGPFGRDDAVTHPQYHLKLLLNRMGVSRSEVRNWHRSGASAAPPQRSHAISNLFLPPEASGVWVNLPSEQRRMTGVRIMESANPEEEAQAIAVLIRQALGVPEKRVTLITPDRGLAARVVAHLSRWNIAADDSAGQPLPQTPAGRLFLLLAEVLADHAAPVPLLALLGHPLVHGGMERAQWLERVRLLDLALRGPRPGPGLAGVVAALATTTKRYPGLAEWWTAAAELIEPLFACAQEAPLAVYLDTMARVAETLCGESIWANASGRSLSAFVQQWREATAQAGIAVKLADLPTLLREAMDEVAVRPPYGAHPRLSIFGLLEARMSHSDLVICGGMTEGNWPASSAPDPLLAPSILRALGIPGTDFRIGLSAHDLASALGAPEVVLSYANRDAASPTIPSRFLMRIRAMVGKGLAEEKAAVALAQALNTPTPEAPAPRPQPMPNADQRRVEIAVTALDRLRGDPYQFYASSILQLRKLDAVDAEPSAAWMGTAVHLILQRWHDSGAMPGTLIPIAEQMLDEMNSHPLMRGLWRPRLTSALGWIENETDRLLGEGRKVVAWERDGQMRVDGVRIHGRCDRIDLLPDGTLAVVDYKTGAPPKSKMVEKGYALQLGLIGMIAGKDGFPGKDGAPHVGGEATRFEYWSLARAKKRENGFGYWDEPILEGRKKTGLKRDEFLSKTEEFLRQAIANWINGNEPFTARLNPDYPGYNDYDQLMRLDEWQARADSQIDPAATESDLA